MFGRGFFEVSFIDFVRDEKYNETMGVKQHRCLKIFGKI